MALLVSRNLRRLLVVAVAGAMVTGGIIGVTLPANAGGMTVVTPRGTLTEYSTGISASAELWDIAAGSDGNLWFTEDGAQKVGRITPQGVITEFSVMGTPTSITLGPDGAAWFVLPDVNQIGRITPSGQISTFSTGLSANADIYDIASGPDGALWFTELLTNKVGRITTDGHITEFALPVSDSVPAEITTGPDDAMWFTANGSQSVDRVTMQGDVTRMATVPGGDLVGIVQGSDGGLWVADFTGRVVRVDTDGTTTLYPTLTANSGVRSIVAGPDGALWFTQSNANKVGRMNTRGATTDYSVGNDPYHITVGPDGALWFAELDAVKIGRVTSGLPGAPASATANADNSAATVSWTVPLDSGMAPVSSYKVTATPGGATCVTFYTACQVSGLKNGTAYTFKVAAANNVGLSPVFATTSPVTPKSPPSVPRSITVKFLKKGSVTVSWKVPALANGAPVTGYQVKWTVVATGTSTSWISTAKTSATKTGFAKGQKIVMQVRAVNSAGTSPIASLKFTQGK